MRIEGNTVLRKNLTVTRKSKIAAIILFVYVGAYFTLSRYSQNQLRKLGMDGFYYFPCGPKRMAEDETMQKLHYAGVCVFYPAWLVDNKVFNGPRYGGIPLMEFDGNSRTNKP